MAGDGEVSMCMIKGTMFVEAVREQDTVGVLVDAVREQDTVGMHRQDIVDVRDIANVAHSQSMRPMEGTIRILIHICATAMHASGHETAKSEFASVQQQCMRMATRRPRVNGHVAARSSWAGDTARTPLWRVGPRR